MKPNIQMKISRISKIICLLTFFSIAGTISCTDKFDEFNTDKSQMMEVGTKELAGLFSQALTEGSHWQMAGLAQKFFATTPMHLSGYTVCGDYTRELNVISSGAAHDQTYQRAYTYMYKHLQIILNKTKDEMPVQYAVALIWKVHVFHRQTDIWGPIPYSEAGASQDVIHFDKQKNIYYQMFDELRAAAAVLEAEIAKNPNANAFGLGDMIWDGKVEKWLRFCNTMRLRLACRISNIEPEKAKKEAEDAVKGIMMETNADDGLYKTTSLTGSSGYGHGMCQMVQYLTDFMSTSMESYMKGYNDPRMPEFWNPVQNRSDILNDYKSNIGGYHGATSGAPSSIGVTGILRAHSLYGPRFADGNQRKTPINVVNASETWFLKAEGAWKGWNMGGNAKTFYDKGIEISLKQWVPTISASAVTSFINSTNVPTAPNNAPYFDPPVSTAPVQFASEKTLQYEQIMIQKWLALFPISVEAYAEFRRTRLPKLYAKKSSLNANIDPSVGQIITRHVFPDCERTTQPDEVNRSAKEDLGGNPDLENTPLWWDINKNGNVSPGKY